MELAAKIEALQIRRNQVGQLVAARQSSDVGLVGHSAVGIGYGNAAVGAGAGRATARSRAVPPPAPPPRAMVPPKAEPRPSMPQPMEMDTESSYDPSVTRAAAESAPSSISSSTISLGGSPTVAVRTSLNLMEPEYFRAPAFSDPSLPAVVAGGLDYVYDAPTKADIPSSGNAFRVPLAVERWPVEVYYEASPALEKIAFLKATVRNLGERPVLGGPVNIFLGGVFTSESHLETTGPGGEIELPLGADEDIRLVRRLEHTTKTEGLVSKEDITLYRTEIDVGNFKRRSVRVRVYEVLPKTNDEDIEVKWKGADPEPVERDKATGRLVFDLTVPAGKTRTIGFAYEIHRPEHWQLRQR